MQVEIRVSGQEGFELGVGFGCGKWWYRHSKGELCERCPAMRNEAKRVASWEPLLPKTRRRRQGLLGPAELRYLLDSRKCKLFYQN